MIFDFLGNVLLRIFIDGSLFMDHVEDRFRNKQHTHGRVMNVCGLYIKSVMGLNSV
jgi:hypothetical protein